MGQLGDLSPEGSIAVGVIVGLISTSVQAIGLTLQRKSHILEDEKDPYELRRPPYKRRRWQLGMLMFVVANIVGSTIQITTLPLPVLSTLQASGLVFNTTFATLILGEPFTRYSVIGTVLVCVGAVLIATFGAIGEPAHTLDQLLELLDQRSFILWMVGTAVIVVIVLTGSRIVKTLSAPGHSKLSRAIKGYGPLISVNRGKLLRGLSFAFASGVLSAHTLLLAKSAVELLVRTVVDHVNQFNRWQSWLILLGMIALALTQLYYMHRSLKLCSTSVLYPFVFCIYNIIAILDGLIYFRQASQLTGLHAGLIALGTVVLLGGVLCLSWRLEDIESHTGHAIPSATQTTLGPGMGIVEEHPEPSEDEEMQVGERQPLLSSTSGRGPSHQRAPSLPLTTSPYRYRAQTFTTQTLNNESAQIWAELDDSENEVAAVDTDSLVSGAAYGPSFRPSRRPRALSLLSDGSYRGRRPVPRDDAGSGSISSTKVRDRPPPTRSSPSLRIWDPRRFRQRDHMSRRTSAPVPLGGADRHPSPRQSRFGNVAAAGDLRHYGTTEGAAAPSGAPRVDPPRNPSHDDEGGFWTRNVRLLQRWTRPAGSND